MAPWSHGGLRSEHRAALRAEGEKGEALTGRAEDSLPDWPVPHGEFPQAGTAPTDPREKGRPLAQKRRPKALREAFVESNYSSTIFPVRTSQNI